MNDYSERLYGITEEENFLNALQTYFEYMFTVIFTLEFLLKVVGMGLIFEKGTYLRNAWNIIDFIVVLSAIISMLPEVNFNITGFRALRVMRPLRSITVIKGQKLVLII